MKLITKLAVALLMLFPLAGMAHGYWIETAGSHKINEPVTIKLIYGEYATGERLSGKFLDKMKDISIFVLIPGKGKQQIRMKQLSPHWEGSFIPPTEGSYEITGINEVREVQDWTKHNLGIVRPVQYLKIIYQVGSAVSKQAPASFLDIILNSAVADKYAIQP